MEWFTEIEVLANVESEYIAFGEIEALGLGIDCPSVARGLRVTVRNEPRDGLVAVAKVAKRQYIVVGDVGPGDSYGIAGLNGQRAAGWIGKVACC